MFIALKPRDERGLSADQVIRRLQNLRSPLFRGSRFTCRLRKTLPFGARLSKTPIPVHLELMRDLE